LSVCNVGFWHIASFRSVAEFGAFGGIADMTGFAAGSTGRE
jgi:hypothetical protein